MAPTVKIDGLKDLVRAVSKIDRSAAIELRRELKVTVGERFALDARGNVKKVDSGRLRDSIKPSVRGADLFVRSSPALKPGPKSRMGYAAVYEYGYGRQYAFLVPTADQWEATGRLKRELNGYLDWLEREFRA